MIDYCFQQKEIDRKEMFRKKYYRENFLVLIKLIKRLICNNCMENGLSISDTNCECFNFCNECCKKIKQEFKYIETRQQSYYREIKRLKNKIDKNKEIRNYLFLASKMRGK